MANLPNATPIAEHVAVRVDGVLGVEIHQAIRPKMSIMTMITTLTMTMIMTLTKTMTIMIMNIRENYIHIKRQMHNQIIFYKLGEMMEDVDLTIGYPTVNLHNAIPILNLAVGIMVGVGVRANIVVVLNALIFLNTIILNK